MKRVLVLTVFVLIPINVAYADAGCSELAVMFSSHSDDMGVNELALLKGCVNKKLRKKLFSDNNMPSPVISHIPQPAPVPMPKMAPDPKPASPSKPSHQKFD